MTPTNKATSNEPHAILQCTWRRGEQNEKRAISQGSPLIPYVLYEDIMYDKYGYHHECAVHLQVVTHFAGYFGEVENPKIKDSRLNTLCRIFLWQN